MKNLVPFLPLSPKPYCPSEFGWFLIVIKLIYAVVAGMDDFVLPLARQSYYRCI